MKIGMSDRTTEKSQVEERDFVLERRWARPVPRFGDHAALNAHLWHCRLTKFGCRLPDAV
jgi:hypothetical protein